MKLKDGTVPTIFSWNQPIKSRRTIPRLHSKTGQEEEEEEMALQDPVEGQSSNQVFEAPSDDHDYVQEPLSLEQQLDAARKEIIRLGEENQNLRSSISDKEITKESGILNLLEEGDEVMADKGFLIKELLADINVKLVIPPFLGPSGQFNQN
ncbi:hypothetical protein SKAU_G00207650 [Synaphobranchus kaupii]|uniref:DDE Tnp4 domain-containing protein n=1 Tax=Synaphobranchus kaupii TaxID=118154 RepID=A0A9Q1F884_SYNKA|nr:hypothetical protein SKAU_G00207650 [Synaphobranchus kaupii]